MSEQSPNANIRYLKWALKAFTVQSLRQTLCDPFLPEPCGTLPLLTGADSKVLLPAHDSHWMRGRRGRSLTASFSTSPALKSRFTLMRNRVHDSACSASGCDSHRGVWLQISVKDAHHRELGFWRRKCDETSPTGFKLRLSGVFAVAVGFHFLTFHAHSCPGIMLMMQSRGHVCVTDTPSALSSDASRRDPMTWVLIGFPAPFA